MRGEWWSLSDEGWVIRGELWGMSEDGVSDKGWVMRVEWCEVSDKGWVTCAKWRGLNDFYLFFNIYLFAKYQNVAQILISCFAKLRKFRPNFDFVFCEISRNSRKISQNTKLKISRKFRKITKTKIFAATLPIVHKVNKQVRRADPPWTAGNKQVF